MIQQGEKEKGFFVITDGTARVTLDGDDLARLMRKHLPQAFATRKV